MNKRVIIIGASGHGKVIADIVRKNQDVVVGFLDDAYECSKDFYGSKIFGTIEKYKDFLECEFIVAIGNNNIREKIAQQLNCNWYTAIDPSAQISKSAKIGLGSCVMPNVVINSDAIIGNQVIVNTGAIIEHDCEIGDFSHLSPKSVVCGLTKIGKRVWLGAGCTVINVLSVCDDVIIGAGSTVIADISQKGTYVGTPIKLVKKYNLI